MRLSIVCEKQIANEINRYVFYQSQHIPFAKDTQQKQTNILKRLAFFVALEHFCRCQIARIGCFMASNILIICGSWRQNGEERLLGEQNQVVYDLFYIFLQYRWRTTETQR
ncbi:unnamed protein product [Albugo candida]|uniref:Uncharacterized protein n=1 Tax=Albugo candida TaxID=65357 RepID=A0A024GBG5_9STRA|nr:unnamed protein product [Albugo candida]|eukprot:CCI43677.1 unnamed protein product [Albugo candida]